MKLTIVALLLGLTAFALPAHAERVTGDEAKGFYELLEKSIKPFCDEDRCYFDLQANELAILDHPTKQAFARFADLKGVYCDHSFKQKFKGKNKHICLFYLASEE